MIRRAAQLRTAVFMVGVMLALVSCELHDRRKEGAHELLSFHTTTEASKLRRVAVLPFFLGDGIGRSAQAMDAAMPAALREVAVNEVVNVSAAQRDMLLPEDPLLANHISIDQLLKLRDALHCDGVLIGRIDQYDSFDPITIGVTAHMISCRDGSVVWSATGEFDGHRDDVQDEIQTWYEKNNGESTANISGWKIVLVSPQLFCRYVADRLAHSIPVVKPNENTLP